MDFGFTIAIISKPDLEMQKTVVGVSSCFRVYDGAKDMNCLTSAQIIATLCYFSRLEWLKDLSDNFICKSLSHHDISSLNTCQYS